MALTPSKSTEYTNYTATPRVESGAEWDSKVRISNGTLVLTASGTGTASMLVLPAGRKLVYPHLSCISGPDGATNADISVGHAAYTDPSSGAVIADIDAFSADNDLGGGPLVNSVLNVRGPVVIDSEENVVVTITVETANALTGTYELNLAYAMSR